MPTGLLHYLASNLGEGPLQPKTLQSKTAKEDPSFHDQVMDVSLDAADTLAPLPAPKTKPVEWLTDPKRRPLLRALQGAMIGLGASNVYGNAKMPDRVARGTRDSLKAFHDRAVMKGENPEIVARDEMDYQRHDTKSFILGNNLVGATSGGILGALVGSLEKKVHENKQNS